MPERSFGRTVRYRRTKLGLSQSQLGELVGRSASSVRSWERDVSTPTDSSVLFALAAILDLDARALFEKAEVELPPEDSHPTLEQALASLAPAPVAASVAEPDEEMDLEDAETEVGVGAEPQPVPEPQPVSRPVVGEEEEPDLDADSELEAEVREHLEEETAGNGEPDAVFEPFSLRPESVTATPMRTKTEQPAFVSPPEPFLIQAPTPPVVEPSYMEDTDQRQLYRVRILATIVLFVGLMIILLWSLSNTLDALGQWWDGFIGTLRL